MVIDKEGNHFCSATITLHQSNPYRRDFDEGWDQFNPMNYPCFCEVIDIRPKPNICTYYVCFALPVTTGDYAMCVVPRDVKAPNIRIFLTRMEDFGLVQHLKWKKK